MKTVLHLNPDLHVNQVLYILYMLVGPKSPSYIPLLSQAHQIEYFDHQCKSVQDLIVGRPFGRYQSKHCQGLLQGRSLMKGQQHPAKQSCEVVHMSTCMLCMCAHVYEGTVKPFRMRSFTLYRQPHQDASLRPGLPEALQIERSNGHHRLCL